MLGYLFKVKEGKWNGVRRVLLVLNIFIFLLDISWYCIDFKKFFRFI